MSEDTARPSNEGSGKRMIGNEMRVEHVTDEDVTKAYENNGYGDLRVVSADPLIIDPDKENTVSGTSGNGSNNAGGIVKVENTAEQNLNEIAKGNYVSMPVRPQNEQVKNNRKNAKANKAKENRAKEDNSGLEK